MSERTKREHTHIYVYNALSHEPISACQKVTRGTRSAMVQEEGTKTISVKMQIPLNTN